MVHPYPLEERQLKWTFIQSSLYASCLPRIIPLDPHKAVTIVSPTFQMMKPRIKEAKKS